MLLTSKARTQSKNPITTRQTNQEFKRVVPKSFGVRRNRNRREKFVESVQGRLCCEGEGGSDHRRRVRNRVRAIHPIRQTWSFDCHHGSYERRFLILLSPLFNRLELWPLALRGIFVSRKMLKE